MPLKSISGHLSHFRPTFFSLVGGGVRPGTTATHHLLPLTPITIKPPTTATTYYDGWWRWWVSMVDVSLQLHWVAVWSHQALTQTTTCYHYQPNHLSHHLLWWLAAIWTLPLNLHERIMGKLVIQGLQYQ